MTTIDEYLDSISLNEVERARCLEMIAAFEYLSGKSVTDVFVSNVVTAADKQAYRDLWGIAPPFWLQARDFATDGDIDVSLLEGSITYIGASFTGYTLGQPASEESRLSLEVKAGSIQYSQLIAAGVNCDQLCHLLDTHLRKNLAAPPTSTALALG